jgi:hypothetical protein
LLDKPRAKIGLQMTTLELRHFMASHRWAVQASVNAAEAPQAALIGIAVSETFEVVFDTLAASRKAINLRANARIAFVIGGWFEGDGRTVQYEGLVDFPQGQDLYRLREIYFAAFPDGPQRQSWPGLIYVRATPTWIRYSNFNSAVPEIQEFQFSAATGRPCTESKSPSASQ